MSGVTKSSAAREQAAAIAEIIARLQGEFVRLNAEHFGGRLTMPTIEFSLRKSFGGYYQKREHRIVLSWQAYREYGWDETINTFRHEVAHIVHLHHRREFWELAQRLGVLRKYARHPLYPKARKLLIYECPGCRRQIHRQRRLSNSSCARCDKRYNPQFRFVLVSEEAPSAVKAQER